MNQYWTGRGSPWEHDPGPPLNRRGDAVRPDPELPRARAQAVLGSEQFRWHFGPMFYRGRLDRRRRQGPGHRPGGRPGRVASATARSSAAPAAACSTSSTTSASPARTSSSTRSCTRSSGSTTSRCAAWPRIPARRSSQHRHATLRRGARPQRPSAGRSPSARPPRRASSPGSSRAAAPCPEGPDDVSEFTPAGVLGPRTKAVGVLHPGGAAEGRLEGGDRGRLQAAPSRSSTAGPTTTRPGSSRDPGATRRAGRRLPVPERPDPVPGPPLRHELAARPRRHVEQPPGRPAVDPAVLGGGVYNGLGVALSYAVDATGSQEGYADEPPDLPYEPPRRPSRTASTGDRRRRWPSCSSGRRTRAAVARLRRPGRHQPSVARPGARSTGAVAGPRCWCWPTRSPGRPVHRAGP